MKRRSAYFFPWPRYPAIRIALLFAAGILLSDIIHLRFITWFILFMSLFGIWMMSEYLAHSTLRISYIGISLSAYLLLLVLFGSCWAQVNRLGKEKKEERAKKLELFAREEVSLTGKINEVFKSSTGNPTLDLVVESSSIQEISWNEKFTIRLYGREGHMDLLEKRNGSRLKARVRVYTLSEPENPGEFD